LQTRDDKWKAVIAAATEKGDEDTAAEYANDLAMLRTLREGLEGKAVEEFGPTITTCSQEPYPPATVPNGEHLPPTGVKQIRAPPARGFGTKKKTNKIEDSSAPYVYPITTV
jgi:hypothetical protein